MPVLSNFGSDVTSALLKARKKSDSGTKPIVKEVEQEAHCIYHCQAVRHPVKCDFYLYERAFGRGLRGVCYVISAGE